MKKLTRLFEKIFVVISLLFFTQGFFTIILGSDVELNPDKDSLLLRLIGLSIYLIAFFLSAFRWQKTLTFVSKNLWILFLVSLAIVSVSWSSVPDISLRKTIALIGTSIFGMYLGSAYNFEEQLKLYGCTFGISIIASFLFVFALPEYGILNNEAITGAWRGIYPHKSGMGEIMSISFITFYFLLSSATKYRLFIALNCLFSIILIYNSQSATALTLIVFIFLIGETLKKLSLKSKESVFLILSFLIIAVFVQLLFILNFNTFLDINGKDITLSGRTTLWESLWEFIRLKLWFGYGYGTFFSSLNRETQLLWKVHTWSPVHAHNGYIQLWINLGLVGLLTFLAGYISCLFNSLFKYLVFKDIKMLWIFSFLVYTVFLNFTEVSFMAINSIVWIISLASIYSMKTIKTT